MVRVRKAVRQNFGVPGRASPLRQHPSQVRIHNRADFLRGRLPSFPESLIPTTLASILGYKMESVVKNILRSKIKNGPGNKAIS